jgi:hypothetical protein
VIWSLFPVEKALELGKDVLKKSGLAGAAKNLSGHPRAEKPFSEWDIGIRDEPGFDEEILLYHS